MTHPSIRARLLGPVDLRRAGAQIEWPRRDARALFLLLLITPGHRISRFQAIESLWPDTPYETAKNSLYKALHGLRRALEPELRSGRASQFIVARHDSIAISPEANIWIDIDRFETLLLASDQAEDPRPALHAALDLYRGPMLQGEHTFDWAMSRQTALANAYRSAALRLAGIERASGAGSSSIARMQRLLDDDPYSEDVHRALLDALVASGQRTAAREHLAWAHVLFDEELGVALNAELDDLIKYEPPLPLSTPTPVVFGLPGLPNRTVGREIEIESIARRLLDRDSRALSIVGPGGVGKTRVAIEVAHQVQQSFSGGVAFIDLTALDDHRMLIPAIGRTIGLVRRPGGLEREVVLATLRRMGQLLLILDNLEHVPDISLAVAELLERAPDARVLATSRTPMRIRAETQIPLEPFVLPDDDEPEVLERNPAVQLYWTRRADWRDLGATGPEDVRQVARLCRYLDGLPLAIELAAARANDQDIDHLLEASSGRFDRLNPGPLDLPDRQRTLEATLEWSCRLLTDEHLELFMHLGVFVDGADSSALVAIAELASTESVDQLVEHQLARWSGAPGRRLTQLETMRSYAMRLLDRRDRLLSARLRHARYFADLVSGNRERRPRGLEQVEYARLLERESPNIYRALETSLELDAGGLAAQICSGMGPHWFTYGPSDAAMAWIDRTWARVSGTISEDSAWTALWGAAIAWHRGEVGKVELFERHARARWEELGTTVGLARVDHAAAQRLALGGDHASALARYRANLPIFEQAGEIEGIVFSRAAVADALAMLGHHEDVLVELEAALRVAREAGDYYLQSHVLARLPSALLDRRELDRSERASLEAERVALLVRDRLALPWSSVIRAWIAWERGDDKTAIELGQLAVERYRDAGNAQHEIHGLIPVAAAMNRTGDPRALSVTESIMRNLIEQPGDHMLDLGLPAVAETLWRHDKHDDALRVMLGATAAAESAALPPHGINARYRAAVRSRIAPAAGFPGAPSIDPQSALDLAACALRSLR